MQIKMSIEQDVSKGCLNKKVLVAQLGYICTDIYLIMNDLVKN